MIYASNVAVINKTKEYEQKLLFISNVNEDLPCVISGKYRYATKGAVIFQHTGP